MANTLEVLVAVAGAIAQADPLGAQAPSGGPPMVDIPSYGAAAARTLIALIVVVALLLIAAKFLPRWLARRPPTTAGGEIEVVASRSIEPRRTLYVVKVRGREYLIGSSEAGLHALSSGPLDQRPGQSFAEVLAAKPPTYAPGQASTGPPSG